MSPIAERLTEKIQTLSPSQLAEVEQFVDRLETWPVEAQFSREAAALSEHAFAAVWSNPDDDAYDAV